MRVAVLGLGRMGAPIARRLRDAGHELRVWNRSPAATEDFAAGGVTILERPADAWEQAELVITMLADDDAARAVTLGEDGLLSGAGTGPGPGSSAGSGPGPGSTAGSGPGPGSSAGSGPGPGSTAGSGRVLADMSTISPRCSAQIASACERSGVTYLRAPVSGNPSVVVAGNLGIIVSGPRDAFEAAAATLREIGPNLFYVGAGEQARVVKLALNLMLGGTTQLLAEALVLGERNGIEVAKMLEVIAGSAIGSPYVKYKTQGLVTGDYSSTFTASLLYKDLALALEAGHDASVPLPLTAATQQLVEGCIAAGMGDLDLSALVPRLRREAGG